MRRKAFTLIELLIVVAIIAILAAIAVPNFLEAQTRARVSRTKADLRSLAVAMEAYYVDYNTYTRDSDGSFDVFDIAFSQGGQGGVLQTGYEWCTNVYNPNYSKVANGAFQLTTPIGYISTLMNDPFGDLPTSTDPVYKGRGWTYRIGSGSWSYAWTVNGGVDCINPEDNQGSHLVFAQAGDPRGAYVFIGVGPDGRREPNGYKCFPFMCQDPVYSEGVPSTDTNLDVDSFGAVPAYIDYDPTNGTVSTGDIYYFGGNWNNSGRFLRNGATVGAALAPGGLGLTAIW